MSKDAGKSEVEHLIEETIEAALRDEELREELLRENSEVLKIKEVIDSKGKTVENRNLKKNKKALEVRKGKKIGEIEKEQAKFFLEGEEKESGDDCCGGGCESKGGGEKLVGKAEGLSKKEILEIINTVIDPEVGVGIVDMGLIYDVENKGGNLEIVMTLTSLGCPVGPQLVSEVEDVLKTIGGAKSVKVDLTFEPPWNLDMMNQDVRAMIWGDNAE